MRLQKNWLEWSVFAIGTVIVAAAVAILITSAVRKPGTPPDLIVRIQRDDQREQRRHRVSVTVQNRGGETATGVSLTMELRRNGVLVEQASLDLPFVPRYSKREASVLFTRDPRCCDVVTGPIAFENP